MMSSPIFVFFCCRGVGRPLRRGGRGPERGKGWLDSAQVRGWTNACFRLIARSPLAHTLLVSLPDKEASENHRPPILLMQREDDQSTTAD